MKRFIRIYKLFGSIFYLTLLGVLVFSVFGIMFAVSSNTILAILSIVLSIASFVATFLIIKFKSKDIPVHKQRVKVLEHVIKDFSGSDIEGLEYVYIVHYFTFAFLDGSREVMKINQFSDHPKVTFDFPIINDMGILTYEEFDSKKYFISFKRAD